MTRENSNEKNSREGKKHQTIQQTPSTPQKKAPNNTKPLKNNN